jgi:hypothetical protein
MRVFSRVRKLGVVAAAVTVLLTVGVEARAQQQIDVLNGTSRPIRFCVFVPSPSNPTQPVLLPDQITLYPKEVGHFSLPAGLTVPFSPNPDGSPTGSGSIGVRGFDPWTNVLSTQGGWYFGNTGILCTISQFAPPVGAPVTVFQIVVPY